MVKAAETDAGGTMDGTTRRRSTALVAAAAVGAVAAGAVLVADAFGGSRDRQPTAASVTPAAPAPKPSAGQLRQARDLLARWERTVGDAVYVPLQPPAGQGDPDITGRFEVRQTGSWSRNQDAYRSGLDQRRIRVRTEISDRSPGDGVVTWRNGSSVRTPVSSAKSAYDRLLAGAMRCDNCPADGTVDGITPRPVTLTAVRLTTLVVETTRGDATVPAWRCAPDGRTLTVGFVGARPSSRIPCGADYFGYPVESAHAVAVVITVRGYPRPVACTSEGHGREVTVRLTAPLAERSALELRGGEAVPLIGRR